jgi:hypothetical protein
MTIYRLKGTSGPVINQAVRLKERLVIGSDNGCDIQVREPEIASQHAELRLLDDGAILLRSLADGQPAQCNGEPVVECRLSAGDEIRVGSCRWMLQAPGLRPERVLTAEAARPARRYWPWLLPIALAAAAVLAWQRGWLGF